MTLRARRPYKTVGMELWGVGAQVNVLIERGEAGLGRQAGSPAQHIQPIAGWFTAGMGKHFECWATWGLKFDRGS